MTAGQGGAGGRAGRKASRAEIGVGGRAKIFYGWWVVLGAALANFAYAEQFNSSYGVFVRTLGAEMGWSRTAVAAVQTVSRAPEALAAVFLGPVVDRHGARWLVGMGGLIVGGAFMALATIDELFELYLYKGLLMPIGAICLGGFLGVTVANWFVARRGRALGLLGTGNSAGTLVMPLLAAFLIEAWGWRQAWFVMGPLVVVLVVPAVVLFRRRPEDVGLDPDGVAAGGPLSLTESTQRHRRQILAADISWTRSQVLRTPVLWIIVFSWALAGLGVTGTNLHLVPYLQDLGYPLAIAAGGISLRAGVMLAAGPLWGLAVERVPVAPAASAAFIFKAAAMLSFLFYPTPLGLVLGLCLYGLGNAGTMVVHEIIWANYFGRVSLGLVRSTVFPMQIAATASGPLLLGVLFDLSGGYELAWLLLSVGFAGAGAIIWFARPPRRESSA